MPSQLTECFAVPVVKALATNSTASSFSALVATVTKPVNSSTRCVFDFTDRAEKVRRTVRVFPYGGNDNNDQISTKVVGWNRVKPSPSQPGPAVDLWVPSLVCEILSTLSSTLTGVAGQAVVATEFFADTVASTKGNDVLTNGTADVDVASFTCDTGGYELVEVICITATGGDASNALVGWVA